MSDIVWLSRWQFAITVGYHFLFVPLTIGLAVLLAVMEILHWRTGQAVYHRMATFWGRLFIINFVLGVITGITMEFQFGTNWSEYAKYRGDIFGSPLAIEALAAFFLESTFLGLWVYGRDRIAPGLRAFAMAMVALGTNISALWIITANGFMQHPVGYVLRGGRAELESFGALVTNPYTWYMFFHTVLAAYIVGAFFVMGVSAWHLARRQHTEFFTRSFRMGLWLALFATALVPIVGHEHGVYTAKVQPAKAAALDAVWETGEGLPYYLIQIPDPVQEKNRLELLPIPNLASFLYTNEFQGRIVGLKEFPPEERPPLVLVFSSFRLMVLLGLLFIALTWYGWLRLKQGKLLESRRYLRLLVWVIPLPYLAINAGWVVAEVGRQPWIVYGLMKTQDAVSPLTSGQVLFSLAGLVVFYTTLIVVDIFLLKKYAVLGPPEEQPRLARQ